MSQDAKPRSLQDLSPLKLALLAERARAESAPLLRADPIAVIGMGCRLPGGVHDPEAFWQLLRDGVDAVTELPSGRWDAAGLYDPDPSAPGRIACKWGGFLESIDGFDAGFFGILPREAERMDPQQRVFLEVAIEALDHAGLPREKLAGSRTGAFVASYYNEYGQLQYADPQGIDARTLTGTLHSVLVNRLSYLLDLRGPSISIDSACSSSLVAIHLACQSLRAGECDTAIAGGVSLMVSEAQMLSLSKVGFMSPDGRCKTFDARADGFGRGEGCALIVLKRLADAVADGDRVLALVRGSAVNQDGHSTVLAAPNGLAQQALIREALANAQVSPSSIGYIEAHGTGTMLGDPIEVEALAATVGQPSPGAGPCLIGAAKANIAHLEAAAGATGFIKSVLVLQHGEIPAQPHFTALNPHISLAGTRLQVAAQRTPWPPGREPRRVGTSGFGIGGTNAHVVLEEAPRLVADVDAPGFQPAPWLLPLSAQSETALRELAGRWADFLGTTTAPLPALAASAGERRSHADHRLAAVAETPAQMIERLRAFVAGTAAPNVAAGRRPLTGARRVGFVFSGQGQQWLGMGQGLLRDEPVFREALTAVDAELRAHVPWSLLDELGAPESRSRLNDTEVAQPAIFGIQVAVAALLSHWGLRPQGVVGHSVGEIAALHVAGVLSLPEAVRIVVQRARFMQRATGQGTMAAVGLSEVEARARLAPFGSRLSIGAVNGPRNVVVSGEPAALQGLVEQLQVEGVAQRALPVNYAFHSAQMQPHADALVAALGSVAAQPAQWPVYSTLTGRALGDTLPTAADFGRNVREPVRFADALRAMLGDGFDTFVEIAAHPVLASAIAECADRTDRADDEAAHRPEVSIVATLRRGRTERESMLLACASLYVAGLAPDWPALQGAHADVLDLPPYPWQHQRFWLKPSSGAAASRTATAGATVAGVDGPAGGLLSRRLPVAGAAVFEARWPDDAAGWLADHRVGGRLWMPGMAMLEALRQAAVVALGGPSAVQVEDFIILRPLELAEGDGTTAATVWQVQATETDGDGRSALALHVADPAVPGGWLKVAGATGRAVDEAPDVAPLSPDRSLTQADVAALYAAFAAGGIEFGAAFRTVQRLQVGAARAKADLALGEAGRFAGCHPGLLDGALQAGVLAVVGMAGAGRHLPLAVQSYVVNLEPGASSPTSLRAEVVGSAVDASGALQLEVRLHDDTGREVARLQGVRLAAASVNAEAPTDARDDWLHEVQWLAAEAESPTAAAATPGRTGTWLLLADESAARDGAAASLEAALAATGGTCHVATPDEGLRRLPELLSRGAGPLAGVAWFELASDEAGTAGRLDIGLRLVQVLASGATGEGTPPQMVWFTRGAQPAGAAVPQPGAAALWGLGSTVGAEHPEFALRLVDLDPDAAVPDGPALAAELLRGRSGESRVALREGRRFLPRLRPREAAAPTSAPLRLQRGQDGALGSLRWVATTPSAPGAGEVQVAVAAAGLNFRDVLMALGMIPGQQLYLGAECAGTVSAVGDGVTHLAPGDAVFGFAPGAFASAVNVPAAFVARWPGDLGSLEQAAALPVAFLTGMVGLQHIARLRAGQRVLVHAAAGGVGLAAVQIAQRAGAEVLATAGSPAKRAMLKRLGVAHVFDSRSTDFAAEIRAATGGRGADVVLNSLAGEFIGASVDALAEDGCFLELGKRDVWTPERFHALRPRARYEVYDLGTLAQADPALLPPLLDELLAALRDGSLRPLPLRVFAHDEAGAAMRLMAQGRHVGKLAVRLPPLAPPADVEIQGDASYLLTGGLGALGLHTARWLVERGARHLVLLGRHAPDARAAATIEALRQAGAEIVCATADAADAAAMRALLDGLATRGRPLRGIVHAAGRLDDGVLMQQDAARFAAVRRGKAEGALLLDALTRDLALDFFVLYSAAGLLLGPAGQGPYAAANAELDALAHRRRSEGRPALSVAWGLWQDGGMATATVAGGHDSWAARGLRWIEPAAGLGRLQRLLRERAVHAAVLPIDWARFLARLPAGVDPAFFGPVAAGPGRRAGGAASEGAAARRDAATGGLVATWQALPSGKRREALVAHLAAQALQVLGLPETTVVAQRAALKEMGLDSLMAVELRNLLARSLATPLPATLLFDHPSLDALANHLMPRLKLVTPEPAANAPQAASTSPRTDAAAIARLSDEEAEAQLLAELQGPAGPSGR